MQPAEVPPDDAARVAAVRALGLVDTPPEERFDRITRTAARVFGVPIASINLVDVDRTWGKSCVGVDGIDADRSITFCAHAVNRDEALVIPDTAADARFADNPFVTAADGIAFYAGQPLRGLGGYRVGTLCLMDHRPRDLDDADLRTLADLAQWAESELESVELSEALAAVRDAEARLRAVMDAVPDGIVTFDEQGRIESVNPAAERVFGYPAALLRGRQALDLLGPDGEEQVAALQRADDRRRFPRGEVSALHADGHRFPLELALSEVDVDGRVVAVGVGRNIAGRKAVEQQLERLRRQNELILDCAPGGIIAVDRSGAIQLVNPAGAALLGVDRADAVGRNLHTLAHHSRDDGAPYPFSDCPIHDTLVRGAAHHAADDVWWRADGTPFHAEYRAMPITEDDEIVGAVVTLADITERAEVDRLKSEFVSVVSHELRTPLTSIKGSLGLLAGGVFGALPPEGARMLEIALTNTDRLVRLINDILDLERMGSNAVELDVRAIGVAELLGEAADATAGYAAEAGVALDVDPVDAVVAVDPDRVVQALTNLVGNAVKFSPAGAAVRLCADVAGDELHLRVADRGRGIPSDRLERIFGRFQQVDASDARDKGGTGLGLAIVKAIAEQHGGRVWAESTLGEGSTFHLVLPVDGPAGATAGTPSARTPSAGTDPPQERSR